MARELLVTDHGSRSLRTRLSSQFEKLAYEELGEGEEYVMETTRLLAVELDDNSSNPHALEGRWGACGVNASFTMQVYSLSLSHPFGLLTLHNSGRQSWRRLSVPTVEHHGML